MRSPHEYAARADTAYEAYMELQGRIDKIEANAKAKYGDVADYKLATGTEYWKYRDLVSLRAVQLEVCGINVSMVGVAKEYLSPTGRMPSRPQFQDVPPPRTGE